MPPTTSAPKIVTRIATTITTHAPRTTTPTTAPHVRVYISNPHYGSFIKPSTQHIFYLGSDDGGANAAAQGTSRLHETAGDLVIALILVIMFLFILFMSSFFYKKYKKISILRNASAYEYSQLSQCEREAGDLTDITDDAGMSVNTSTDEEELEPACPATISVTSSYISPHAAITNNNNNQNKASDDKGNNNNNVTNNNNLLSNPIQPDAAAVLVQTPTGSLIHSPVPILPQMPPPLQPEITNGQKLPVQPSLFTDSDEELLQ